MPKSALVIGATGLIGSHLLEELLENELYEKVVVIGRRSTGVRHPKLVEHIFDLSEMDRHAELFRADSFFCCMGTTIAKAGSRDDFREIDYKIPVKAAILTKQNGGSSAYLVSSIGASASSRVFYLRVKGETEDAMAEVGFQRTLVFRPAGLLGKRNEFRLKEKIGIGAMNLLSPLMVGPLRKNRPIKAECVASVMANLPSENIKGKRIYESDEIQQLYNSMNAKEG